MRLKSRFPSSCGTWRNENYCTTWESRTTTWVLECLFHPWWFLKMFVCAYLSHMFNLVYYIALGDNTRRILRMRGGKGVGGAVAQLYCRLRSTERHIVQEMEAVMQHCLISHFTGQYMRHCWPWGCEDFNLGLGNRKLPLLIDRWVNWMVKLKCNLNLLKTTGHNAPVTLLKLDPLGKILLSGDIEGRDRSIRLWNLSSGELDCLWLMEKNDPNQNFVASRYIVGGVHTTKTNNCLRIDVTRQACGIGFKELTETYNAWA